MNDKREIDVVSARANVAAPADVMLGLYETMQRIRRFEERTTELFKAGQIKGTAHSYAGQEAIAAGICLHLRASDAVGSYHRGHGHCIAKGARLDRMMAELMGKATGYCKGLGGSMHIADLGLNILGANGIVGATMPLGTGAALASKLRGSDDIVVAFFGDGAANQGVFHESLNLAAVWRLPMVFVCENNGYALNTDFHTTTSVAQIAHRAAAYRIPGITVDGNDAIAVWRAMEGAVARARGGEGPSLIEAMTWRWGPHSMRANLPEPRTDAEMSAWKARDPIPSLRARMTEQFPIEAGKIELIHAGIEREIAEAIEYGRAGPEPTLADAVSSVYAPAFSYAEPPSKGDRPLSYAEALNEALAQEMGRDTSVILLGEDIAATGGIFRVTKGLVDKFGSDRVRDTPISEATFCGTGIGAAIAGLRPVVEVQIFDFVTLMMDMLVNQAAKFRFMNGGVPKVPLVVRGPQGGGIRLAAQHSQSLEAWFTHIPGLKVVAPSTPYDAKGLLIASIRDDNPVVFLEHKLLYLAPPQPVPRESYAITLGKADIKRPGRDVTVIATQAMVAKALQAAALLEREGISVEVIDPRTLRPLDEDMILDSVRRTNRLVVAHEGWKTGGFGAEISAIVMEKAFDWLDAPVTRVGALDIPMPFNDSLESQVIPDQQTIVDAINSLYR